MIIAFLVFCFFILIIVCAGVVRLQNNLAKKQARSILLRGRIDDTENLGWAMGVLNKMSNDLEAADLWKKLQELK